MKFPITVRASIFAFAGFALTVDCAFAASDVTGNPNGKDSGNAVDCPASQTGNANAGTGTSGASKNLQSDAWRQSSAGSSCGTPGAPKCNPSDQRSVDKANRAKCAKM